MDRALQQIEIPVTELTPIASKIQSLCEIPNNQLAVDDINTFLFGGRHDESNYVTTKFLQNNSEGILEYLEKLSHQIIDRTARAILQLDIDFFHMQYSGKLEIHGETGQIVDRLTEEDLKNLEHDPGCLKLYKGIKSNQELLFKLNLGKTRIKKLKQTSWIDGIL